MKLAILSRKSDLYSTRRLKEAGEERGHEVHVIDHLQCDIMIEQNALAMYYQGQKLTDYDAVIPRIGASVTFYGTAVLRQFEMMDVFSANRSIAITRSRDKLRSLQMLAAAGLDLPKTAFTNYSKEEKQIIQNLGGAPLIVKLLEGTQGLGVVLAETIKAAKSVIEAFHGLKARIIVQEFIKEAKASDIRAFIVDGEVVGAMKRTGKEGEFRSNLHRGGSAELIRLKRSEKAAAIKAAAAMGLHIAGVDMLQSDRGPLILEVNSSPGLEGIETATEKDIAGKIIEFVERNYQNKRGRKKNA
ncbi:30S ribosomal protein S6--L-glutamate ligase [Marinoscillum sp. 108]|jgi:ribosomal protein S6--L-glutamate ligase|uniref:30S ribosomal protein S6--L-glutamate ligase n=1 Tax=Marinoscillum luteum TaxID=861051 RepID=A0ABW7N8T6_9BACT|nr:30S ribosomal protein S6--L-glutamate ligase [Marinoscillum sp. 108]VXD18595.1 ribosomal protein S6 modification protein [Marinoscillum sp. 108]